MKNNKAEVHMLSYFSIFTILIKFVFNFVIKILCIHSYGLLCIGNSCLQRTISNFIMGK